MLELELDYIVIYMVLDMDIDTGFGVDFLSDHTIEVE